MNLESRHGAILAAGDAYSAAKQWARRCRLPPDEAREIAAGLYRRGDRITGWHRHYLYIGAGHGLNQWVWEAEHAD